MPIRQGLAVSKIPRIAIVTIIGLSILIGGTAWIAFQPPSRCGGGVCTVTLVSATLQSEVTASNLSQASSNFTFTLTNPGETTYISSIFLYGGNITDPVTYWSTSPNESSSVTFDETTMITWNLGNGTTVTETGQLVQTVRSGNVPTLLTRMSRTFTFFPVTKNESVQIMKGQSYSFLINFSNGQSVSWSEIAQ